ncbi:MAG TPA: succinylglutamate desuccinylase/aspartoacylase family protein [Acidimicrobiia bacterium]
MTWTEQGLLVAGEIAPMGTKTVIEVPVFVDLSDAEINLVLHAVVGVEPGPVLGLHTGTHGSEWASVDITRRLVKELDPATMKGAVLALPVANPVAFGTQTRNTRDESDSPDLNRSFGGQQTWIADQLARAIADHLYTHVDALIDFHSGIWGSTMGSVTCGRDFDDPAVSEAAYRMARAFGLGHVRRGDLVTRFPGPKSGVGFAGQSHGVPGIISEIGGAGFDPAVEAAWSDRNHRGILGVMRELGILDGVPDIPDEVLIFDSVLRVNPAQGGIVEPVFPVEGLMSQEVQPGEVLGVVWSPYTFEIVEELVSPVRGLVDMTCRQYPVRPGDWAFIVVDLDAPGTRILSREEMP